MHWRAVPRAESAKKKPRFRAAMELLPQSRLIADAYSREYFMKIAGTILAAVAALGIAGTSALAQQMRTGMVTGINRISSTISIKDMPDGTTGANAGAATEEFKVQDGAKLNDLHAGDRVSFAVSEAAGSKTITKIDKADAVTRIEKK
jgi:Cu/Ag efflux protein CusF